MNARGIMTPEEMALLAIRKYEGPIHLVASAQDLARAVQVIRGEKVVGLDTETRPAFRKGESYLPCLVQIATASAVYLFQLKWMEFSGALAEILKNAELIKAGIGLADDLKGLKKVFPFEPQNLVDLSLVAQARGFERSSVRSMAGEFLGFRVTKGSSTSSWDRPYLTPKQIAYAATDAWVCRELFLRFQQLGFVDAQGRPAKKPLHLMAKDYVDILERIERTNDPQKRQKLEEKRTDIHWKFMESLKEQGIEIGDRFDAARKAFELVQKVKVP